LSAFIGKAIRWLGYGIAIMIISAAAAVSATQLLSPYLNDHRADFAAWASDLLHVPISINEVKIAWFRGEPEVVLQHVVALNKQTQKPTFEVQTIKFNIRILQSILQKKLLAEDIRIYGVHLSIHQKKSGQFNVVGLDNFVFMDNLTGNPVAGSIMSHWIFSQPHLALRNIEIEFIPESGKQRSISLASLNLQNSKTDHVLSGEATLNQTIPMQIEMNLQWTGDSSDILHRAEQADLYLYLKNISLPEWLSQKSWKNLQIKQGEGSGKCWIRWEHGQLQKVQTQLQLYAVRLESLITKKSINIPRINGRLSWHQAGERQQITGENILIDFPQHVWPATQFSFSLLPMDQVIKPPFKNKAESYTFEASYLDLADINSLALASGLLPASLQNKLQTLNPKGEVNGLKLQSSTDFSMADDTQYSTNFTGVALNAWNNFPGVSNLSGKISWDGKQGELTLDSKKTTFILNSFFNNPLQFDTATGEITWQKNAENAWIIDAKNFSVMNEDISVNTTMNLLFPSHESPTIHLTGDFSVPHVEHIIHYLPIKKFEPSLVSWLYGRFQSGQLISGKMTIQGKFSDFTSENEASQFLISTQVKNLEFDYAPGWPMLHHVDGDLVFSGHSMTAEIESGQLDTIPLTKVHGYIPYMGPLHPQVLELQALIHADLAQGLGFIQQSPLRNTLGKDLADIELSGAMGLKLALTIPVKTPENSAVKGDITLSSSILTLPSWHLTLNRLAGDLFFTEKSVQIDQMQGYLFDEPITLSMNTISDTHAIPTVKSTLQGNISQPLLEKWLNMPLSQFIKGTTPYIVELNIVSHKYTQPSELMIRSHLTGLAINLPGIYGKPAEESRDFQLSADLKAGQPLQTKIQYGKLLTAALTFNQSLQGWQLKGGELRLGDLGQATWQSQPGLLLTGQVDKLDWNQWHHYFSSLSLGDKNKKNDANALAQYLRGVDLVANQFPILGQNLTQVRVQVSQDTNTWNINVTSPEATGQVKLPMTPNQSAIQAQFQHLYLTAAENQQPIDPKTIPAFSFTGDDIRYKNQYIGHVVLESAPMKSGLKLSKLNIFTDFFDLNAKGDWLVQNNKQQTNLSGVLTTKNVSQLLTHWDLGSANLVANEGDMTFDLRWADTPYHPSLNTLSGSLFLKLGKGRVINLGNSTDAKLGFGRMLNILNLQTLPRRLSLDFTDVFEKGYSFDTMQGHFNLNQGNAMTQDTFFAGPIARIEIQGRIGFAAKDYDLTLSVTPYVTGSIPVVATLAAGPLVGAVTWIVEKAASSVVSKAATYHYTVQGPWDHPIWAQTKRGDSELRTKPAAQSP